MLIGPLVGGLLSSKTPKISKTDGAALQSHPYALPNLCIAGVYALAALGVFLLLDETLPSLQHMKGTYGSRAWSKVRQWLRAGTTGHRYSAIGSEDPESPSSPDSPLQEFDAANSPSSPPLPSLNSSKLPFWRIWTFNVVCTMLAHFIIAGHLGTFAALWAIFLSTPPGRVEDQHPPLKFDGGAGMQARDVGFAMSLLGAIGVVLQAAVYPMLNDRFGTVRTWRMGLFVFPIVYILAPYLALVASASQSTDGPALAVWVAMAGILLLFVVGRTAVTPATTLLINDCTPHPSVRGSIHTAGTVFGNLGRTIFPIAVLAIFGRGLQIGYVGLGFWCLACLGILACIASRWVQEGSNGNEIKL